MSRQYFDWNEKQAEELVSEFLERESFSEPVVAEATDYIDRDEPIRALEVVMDARSRNRAAGD